VIVCVTPGVAQTITGDAEAGRQKATACGGCHGADGNSTNPAIPSLAGQPPLYTYYQLIQFKLEKRRNPAMAPFIAPLDDDAMRDIALYYAAQRPAPGPAAPDPAKAAAGAHVAARHFCTSCHRPDLSGQNQVPRLSALSYPYLVEQLRGYKAQTRADTDYAMTMAAQPLTEEDIELLAHFITAAARR
jgi:cytochrome c553